MLPKNLWPLLPYLKRYRWGYIFGTVCVFLTNGIWILFPLVIGKAADDLHTGVTQHKLLVYAGLLLAIAVTKGIFQFLTRWVVIGISRDIEFDLRNDLFARLEDLSYSYYQRHRTGDIMARATNDLNAVRMLLGPAIMYSANTLVYTVGALSFMISISPWLTLFTFLPLPGGQHYYSDFRPPHSRALRANSGHVLRHLGSRPGELLRSPFDSRLCAGRS